MSPPAWPEGIVFATGAETWVFREQQIIFTEVTATAATPRDVHAMLDMFLWLSDELSDTHEPIVVHDWRMLRSVPRSARQVFMSRRHELRGRPRKLLIAADINPILRMAIRTATLAAQMMSIGVPLDFIEDPFFELGRLGVSAPDPVLHARLRASWRRVAERSWHTSQ